MYFPCEIVLLQFLILSKLPIIGLPYTHAWLGMFLTSIRLFQKAAHAALYGRYRPKYPESLIKHLLDYHLQNGGGQELALDVCCGSGQSTFQLQEHFKQCVGVDVSRAQIKEAQEKASSSGVKDNVKFLVADATQLPVESGTVDLVTVATAWHWIQDKIRFYSECKRVLKPKGCVAVYSYGIMPIPAPNHSASQLIQHFIHTTLKEYYWRKELEDVHNEYKGVILPFCNIKRHDLVMSHQMSVADLIGFVSSWSTYQKFCEAHPGSTALQELQHGIMTELIPEGKFECSAQEVQVDIQFPLFVLLGQK